MALPEGVPEVATEEEEEEEPREVPVTAAEGGVGLATDLVAVVVVVEEETEGVDVLDTGGLLSVGLPSDSLRLIQLLSLSVTFLYLDLPEEEGTATEAEFRGALTCLEAGELEVWLPDWESKDGGGTELEMGVRTVASSVFALTEFESFVFLSCSALGLGTQLCEAGEAATAFGMGIALEGGDWTGTWEVTLELESETPDTGAGGLLGGRRGVLAFEPEGSSFCRVRTALAFSSESAPLFEATLAPGATLVVTTEAALEGFPALSQAGVSTSPFSVEDEVTSLERGLGTGLSNPEDVFRFGEETAPPTTLLAGCALSSSVAGANPTVGGTEEGESTLGGSFLQGVLDTTDILSPLERGTGTGLA